MNIIRRIFFALMMASLGVSSVAQAQTITAGSSQTIGRAPAWRQVASRSAMPRTNLGAATGRWQMARSMHYMRAPYTGGTRMCWANWRVASNVEIGNGAGTIKTSLEYPAGTFTRSNEEIANGGNPVTQPANSTLCLNYAVNVPVDYQFWARSLVQNDNGTVLRVYGNSFEDANTVPGEGQENGTGTVSDKVTSGTVGTSSLTYAPIAILGITTKPGVVVIGDSLVEAGNDRGGDAAGESGIIMPTLGRVFGNTNFSESGSLGSGYYSASRTFRDGVINSGWFDYLVDEYGTNDLGGGATTAAVQTTRQNIRAAYPTLSVIDTTIPPRTTSTNGWIDIAGQDATNTQNVKITALNELVRAGQTGATAYWDIADSIDPGRTGKWSVNRNLFATAGPKTGSFTGSIASNGTLTITAVSSGTLALGDCLTSSTTNGPVWNTDVAFSTCITALGSGTGGTGTYTTYPTGQTVTSRTMVITAGMTWDGLHPGRLVREIIRASKAVNLELIK